MRLVPEMLVFMLAFTSLGWARACGQTLPPGSRAAVGSTVGSGAEPHASPAPDAKQELELTLKPAVEVWNSRKPLVVDLSFRNAGDKSVFLNLKSAFQVYGYLEDRDGRTFEIEWSPEGLERMPVKEDYTELPPGKTLVLKLTSRKIRSEGGDRAIPWRAHKSGEYTLYIQFASGSKTHLMSGQWDGTQTSRDVKLKVR